MIRDDVVKYLCNKDSDHPDYFDQYGYLIEEDIKDGFEPEIPPPRVDCFCDNCFYSRDELAVELLKYMEK